MLDFMEYAPPPPPAPELLLRIEHSASPPAPPLPQTSTVTEVIPAGATHVNVPEVLYVSVPAKAGAVDSKVTMLSNVEMSKAVRIAIPALRFKLSASLLFNCAIPLAKVSESY